MKAKSVPLQTFDSAGSWDCIEDGSYTEDIEDITTQGPTELPETSSEAPTMVSLQDTDQCASNDCDVNSTCNSTTGSYKCECISGYQGQF